MRTYEPPSNCGVEKFKCVGTKIMLATFPYDTFSRSVGFVTKLNRDTILLGAGMATDHLDSSKLCQLRGIRVSRRDSHFLVVIKYLIRIEKDQF